jgi:hypothetical protein
MLVIQDITHTSHLAELYFKPNIRKFNAENVIGLLCFILKTVLHHSRILDGLVYTSELKHRVKDEVTRKYQEAPSNI